ncbi:unnamed protein product [Laminaria digitata]
MPAQGEILASIGLAGGLKASILLSTCCLDLWAALTSPLMDEQLFGNRLYAALAGVENPEDALLQPPLSPPPPPPAPLALAPPQKLNRRQPSGGALPSISPDRHHHHHLHRHLCGDTSSSSPSLSTPPSPSEVPVGVKRGRHCRPPPDKPAAAAATAAGGEGTHRPNDDNGADKQLPRSALPGDFWTGGGEGGAECRGGGAQSGSLGPTVEQPKPRRLCRPGVPQAWKGRLRRGLAAGSEPSEMFLFPALGRGKQDVLMAVVPSSPPVVAITCTTDLSLYFLDGTPLPAIPQPWNPHPAGGDTSPGGEEGEESSGGSYHDSCAPQPRSIRAEGHQRDIRCLAGSPAGDMVATGSLDCTIRVRSVPRGDWVRRLRGHNAGVRCLVFHRNRRLVSADSLGFMSVWDVFPVVRKLQTVLRHSDSVQAMGGSERLASGALDGSVVIWSMSSDGTVAPVVTYYGLCHPYRLAAFGRCFAFTSMAAPGTSIWEPSGSSDCGNGGVGVAGDRGGDLEPLPSPTCKGSHVSVVNVDASWGSGQQRVCTGEARVHHLAAGACVGSVMLSPAEPWACHSDDSSGDDEPSSSGAIILDHAPRLCHIASAEKNAVGVPEHVLRSGQRVFHGGGGGCGGGGGGDGGSGGGGDDLDRDLSDVCKLSFVSPVLSMCRTSGRDHLDGLGREIGVDLEGVRGGALCTCAAFVGRTVFLGYDTGGVWAHRVSDGRRLYR